MPEPSMIGIGRSSAPWFAAAAVVFAVGALVGVGDSSVGVVGGAVVGVVPVAVLSALLAGAVRAGRTLLAAALALAAPPAALSALADAEPAGAMAVSGALIATVVSSPRFRRLDPGVRSTAVATAVVVLAGAWVWSTPSRPEPSPDWRTIVEQTGTTLRRAVVGVGGDGSSIALAALLVWLLAAAVLTGVGLVARRRLDAWVLPAAVVAVVVGAWAIERWRGPVEPGSSLWLLGGAVVATAARCEVGGAGDRPGRRRTIASIAGALAGVVTGLGVVHHVRRAGVDGAGDARIAAGVLAAGLLVVAIRSGGRAGLRRGVTVVVADDRNRPAATALAGALGAAPPEWVGEPDADGSHTSGLDTTVVVGSVTDVEVVAASRPDLLAPSVRRVLWLTAAADGTDAPGGTIDEIWVAATERRVDAGTRPVRHVAMPPDADGSSGRPGGALAAWSRQVGRVLAGWAPSAQGVVADGDGSPGSVTAMQPDGDRP